MANKSNTQYLWYKLVLGGCLLYGAPTQAEEFIPQVGMGIFYNFGASSDWGLEIYGNIYPLDLSEAVGTPIYMGGNLQVNFAKEEKATFVYSFQTGLDFMIAKSGIELGLAQQDGKSAFQYGVHLHGLLPTLSWRSAKGLDKSYVGIGLRADVLPLAYVIAVNIDGRPLRTQEGIAPLPTLIGSSKRSFQKKNPWLSAAHSEWASIAAFEDLVRQLVCCHTPKTLIKRAKKAMEDEFRHTVLCAGIAAKISGSPVLLPEIQEESRTSIPGQEGLLRIALESWFDGCINEGLAAEKLKHRAKEEQDEDARSALIDIIHDEEEHTELAWDILAWSLKEGDESVQKALLSAKERVPDYITEKWQRDLFHSAQYRLSKLLG